MPKCMPIYFIDGRVVSVCSECSESFSDKVNEARIFDDLPCVGCTELNELIAMSACPVPEEPTPEEVSQFYKEAYAR
jgi:hypothetical protein